MTKKITIYGSNQCQPCINLKKNLDNKGIKYTFKDVDKQPRLLHKTRTIIDGKTEYITPTIYVCDGKICRKAQKLSDLL